MDAKENGEQGITGYATECGCSHGLTKREHFAAMAMQGILSNQGIIDSITKQTAEWVAEHAVISADALLRALAHSAGSDVAATPPADMVPVPREEWTIAQILANAWRRHPLTCGERDKLVAEWDALRSGEAGKGKA